MMKRFIIFILSPFCSLATFAQEPTQGNFPGAYRYKNRVYIDSILLLPNHNSATPVPLRDGGMRYNPTSGKAQLWIAPAWTDFATSAGSVPTSRTINTTAPLLGGGDLSADRVLSITDAAADGATKGAASFAAADFNSTAGNITLDYTNGQAASGSAKGFLSSADWTIFNNKLTSLNGLTAQTQTFNTSTAGNDFAINSSGDVHTFNLPNASATARGVVTTAFQTFAGSKVFGNNIVLQNVPARATAAPLFYVPNSDVVNTRTAAQVLSDIGGAPESGSGNYIQNQSIVPQVANFHMSAAGYTQTNFTVYKAGSASLDGFIRMTTDVPGTRGAVLQLTEGVNPGLAAWIHDGSTGYVERMRITAAGGVGIGTTVPEFDGLHLMKTASTITTENTNAYTAISGGLLAAVNTGTPSATNQRLGLLGFGSSPVGAAPLRLASAVEAFSEGAWTDNVAHPSDLRFYTTNLGTGSATEKMRITENGDVGLGVTTPATRLHVGGALTVDGFIDINGLANITGLGSASFTSLAVSGVTTLSGGLNANTISTPSLITTGEFRAPIRTTAISTTLTATDHTLRATVSGITLTLPAASGVTGRIYVIINYNTGGTVTTSAFFNFAAVSTTTVANQSSVMIQSDGTNWYQIK